MEDSIEIMSPKHSFKSALILLVHYVIAGVLILSGISKIIDPESFLKVLNVTLGFLGENTIVFIASILPVIEVALGFLLILKIKVKETLIATVILFATFLIFAIYGTIKGFDVDCGCFGTGIKNEFGIWMILRNLLLVVITYLKLKYFNERNAI